MFKSIPSRIVLVVAAFLVCMTAAATDVTGAGSSFVYPLISKWSATYAKKTGNRINYQSIGSGGGIAQMKIGTVAFGASDKPLDAATLDAHGLMQFPDVIGGIVPALNLPGVATGKLVLDGPTLANIFLGKIKRWNAPAIRALNPGLTLPDRRIVVVHRADGSGTTFNFTNYLSKISPAWASAVGEGTAVNWPAGIGGKGNEGVAAYLRQVQGSIGYLEYAYALRNHIDYAVMKNSAGHVVKPSIATFQAAAASADWRHASNFNLMITNAPGDNAWPITAASWIIMRKQGRNTQRRKAILDFFAWAYEHGQAQARSLDYVPLPPSLVKQIAAYWKAHEGS